jgi:hypothetical protein
VYSGIDWDTPFLVRESLLSVGEIFFKKKIYYALCCDLGIKRMMTK